MKKDVWKFEKANVIFRWALFAAVFIGLFFLALQNSNEELNVLSLLKLGIIFVIAAFVLQILLERMSIEVYRCISCIYDVILIGILIYFTGGVFLKGFGNKSVYLSYFVFLFPVLILLNVVSRPWYWALVDAIIINGFLLYYLIIGNNINLWPFLFILTTVNLLLGFSGLFYDYRENKNKVAICQNALRDSKKSIKIIQRPIKPGSDNNFVNTAYNLSTILQVTRFLGSSNDLGVLFENIVNKTRDSLDSKIAFLMVKKENNLQVASSVGISEITKKAFKGRIDDNEYLFKDIIDSSNSIRLKVDENPLGKDFFSKAIENIKDIIIAPLISSEGEEPLGVISVANPSFKGGYSKTHEDLLMIFAYEAGMFIRQLKIKEGLEKDYFGIIGNLASAIEQRNLYSKEHIERVVEYSVSLAKALRLSIEEISRIEKAAVLHDIGKISTPLDILNKPSSLTKDEYEIVKQHSTNGRRMLSEANLGIDEKIKDYVEYHHERWDGKGYPKGLKGEEIPLGAQIISLADTFDALTSDRPYRKSFNKERALSILMDTAGKQFNPKILHLFFEMMNFDINTKKILK